MSRNGLLTSNPESVGIGQGMAMLRGLYSQSSPTGAGRVLLPVSDPALSDVGLKDRQGGSPRPKSSWKSRKQPDRHNRAEASSNKPRGGGNGGLRTMAGGGHEKKPEWDTHDGAGHRGDKKSRGYPSTELVCRRTEHPRHPKRLSRVHGCRPSDDQRVHDGQQNEHHGDNQQDRICVGRVGIERNSELPRRDLWRGIFVSMD